MLEYQIGIRLNHYIIKQADFLLTTNLIYKMRKIYFLFSVLCLTTLFTSCSEDDKDGGLKISPKEMNLVVGQTAAIKIDGGVSGNQFTSGNEFIASVKSDGVVTAVRVGETEITVRNKNNSTAKCKVKITGKSKLYTEPYLKFGASVSQVKSFEKRTLKSEDNEFIYYKGENKYVEIVAYNFENKKTISSAVFSPVSKSNAELIVEFLSERYIMMTDGDETVLFMSPDEKIIGGIDALRIGSDYYYLIVYAPAQNTPKRTGSIDITSIKEKVLKVKNDMNL